MTLPVGFRGPVLIGDFVAPPVVRPNLPGIEGWPWKHFLGSREALRYAKRELEHVAHVLTRVKGRDVVVQAGGSLGIFPKYLAGKFAAVYTFEPAPDSFRALLHNAPEPNIFRFQAALGAAPAFVGLSRDRRDHKPNVHEGITYVHGAGPVPTLRIDDFGLPVCDLIYLDIEGGELGALQGAQATIARCRPVLAFEFNKNAVWAGVTPEDVRSLLDPLGYRHVARYGSDDVYVPC